MAHLKILFYPLICFHEKSTHDVACCLLKRWIVIKNVTEYQITSHSKCVCVPLSKHNLRCYMFPLDVSIGFSTVSNENHATLRWYHMGIKVNFLKIIPFPIQSRSISVLCSVYVKLLEISFHKEYMWKDMNFKHSYFYLRPFWFSVSWIQTI